MKKKQLFLLISILIALLVVGLVKKAQKSAQFEKQEASTSLEITFEKTHVEKIRLRKSESNSYELVKEAGEWKIPSLWNSKADAPKIGNLLEQLSNLSGELRANSGEVLSDFDIADANSFSLVLIGAGEKELAHLLISYKTPESGGSFVRLKDSNAVYLVGENLFSLLGIFGNAKTEEFKANYWSSLKYFSVDPTKAEFLTLKKMDGSKESVLFDLTKDATQDRWSIKDTALPFPIASEKVYRFLGQISQGMAREVADPAGQYGLDQPDWILISKETDKEVTTLKIKAPSDKAADFVYLSTSETTSIFKVTSSVTQSLNVEPSYFEPSAPFFDTMKDWEAVRVKTSAKAVNFTKSLSADNKPLWKIDGQEPQPEQQKIDEYLKKIEGFSVSQYLAKDKELPKDLGVVSLEFENSAKEVIRIDVSGSADSSGSYAAQKAGAQPGFLISKATYDQIFELPQ